MPLEFTEEQRRALSSRLMLQPPGTEMARLERSRIEGIPADVLATLEAIKLLADQGNRVAQDLYMAERRRLGIDIPSRFGPNY
jgi:hypothetical protein